MTSEQRIRDTVKARASHYRIGDLLVLLDLITPDQLVEALAEQKKRPGTRLGAVVLEKRFVVERHLLQALSYQFGRALHRTRHDHRWRRPDAAHVGGLPPTARSGADGERRQGRDDCDDRSDASAGGL